MSRERYEDDCPGCRPAVLDVRTGQALPEDSPEMQAVMALWAQTTLKERQAWHRVTCQNSRATTDLALTSGFVVQIQTALQRLAGTESPGPHCMKCGVPLRFTTREGEPPIALCADCQASLSKLERGGRG